MERFKSRRANNPANKFKISPVLHYKLDFWVIFPHSYIFGLQSSAFLIYSLSWYCPSAPSGCDDDEMKNNLVFSLFLVSVVISIISMLADVVCLAHSIPSPPPPDWANFQNNCQIPATRQANISSNS